MIPCPVCGVEVECLHRNGQFTPADVRNIVEDFKQEIPFAPIPICYDVNTGLVFEYEIRNDVMDFARDIKSMGIRAAFEKWGIEL